MRTASIKFEVTFDAEVPEHLDIDWVADRLMFSDRFSTLSISGDPVQVIGASTSIKSVTKHKPPVS
jgi:hypothetical protein